MSMIKRNAKQLINILRIIYIIMRPVYISHNLYYFIRLISWNDFRIVRTRKPFILFSNKLGRVWTRA